MGAPFHTGVQSDMSLQLVAVRARKRTVWLVAALTAALPLVGLSAVPRADAADPTLSFVAAANSAGNRTNHAVTLPAGIQAGDTLVLFMTVNSLSGTLGSPSGWNLLQSKDGSATRGRAWTKQATAGDAGATVTVAGTEIIKDAMSVAAYRSNGGTSAVTASASTAGTTTATSFTAPSVAVAQPGSWLVNSWSEKSSTASTWTAPASSTARTSAVGTGGGKVSSLLADSNAAVPTGTAAGRTATTSVVGGASQLFSVVVSPGTGTVTPPTNQPPVPSFTTSCTGMTCSFNAGATTDPDNNPLTYNWAFGDGTTGSGVTASRTYTTAGSKTVTLTVGDGTTTAQTTRSVSPTAGTTTGVLSYVGSASSTSAASTRTSHTVQLPANVQAGDTLVLFLTVNSLSGTLSTPAGWTVLQSKSGSVTRGRAWTRRATVETPGPM